MSPVHTLSSFTLSLLYCTFLLRLYVFTYSLPRPMLLNVVKEKWKVNLTGFSQNNVYNLKRIFNRVMWLYYNFLAHYYFITPSQLLLSSSSQYFFLHSFSQLMTLLHIAKCKAMRPPTNSHHHIYGTHTLIQCPTLIIDELSMLWYHAYNLSLNLLKNTVPAVFLPHSQIFDPFSQLLASHYFAPLDSKNSKMFFVVNAPDFSPSVLSQINSNSLHWQCAISSWYSSYLT